MYLLPQVKGKTRLCVLCALTPQFHGLGPHNFNRRYVWNYRGLIVGRDPVAVDTIGLRLIMAKRRKELGPAQELPPVPKHIQIADTSSISGPATLAKSNSSGSAGPKISWSDRAEEENAHGTAFNRIQRNLIAWFSSCSSGTGSLTGAHTAPGRWTMSGPRIGPGPRISKSAERSAYVAFINGLGVLDATEPEKLVRVSELFLGGGYAGARGPAGPRVSSRPERGGQDRRYLGPEIGPSSNRSSRRRARPEGGRR